MCNSKSEVVLCFAFLNTVGNQEGTKAKAIPLRPNLRSVGWILLHGTFQMVLWLGHFSGHLRDLANFPMCLVTHSDICTKNYFFTIWSFLFKKVSRLLAGQDRLVRYSNYNEPASAPWIFVWVLFLRAPYKRIHQVALSTEQGATNSGRWLKKTPGSMWTQRGEIFAGQSHLREC